uniref:MYND-type domain-containing protein n=1 Tax=Tetradesmus obliquus TaxID=3088 RepID=A0A383VLT5_TETOB|eukprot:jgi/Sobl393_1/8075/SZX65644.1
MAMTSGHGGSAAGVQRLLQTLIAAPDLAYLKYVGSDERHDVVVLQAIFKNMEVQSASPDTQALVKELVHQHSIFKLLGQASSRALQLLLKATDRERSKPVLLYSFMQLQGLLPMFHVAWFRCTADLAAAGSAAERQLAVQQLQESDLLQVCAAACQRDTVWLEQQLRLQQSRQQRQSSQQQQQQQQPGAKKQAAKKQRQAAGSLSAVQADAAACLRIGTYISVYSLLADCCGEGWLAGQMAPHIGLCVRLAWAVLRCKESCRISSSTTSSSSSSSSSSRSSSMGETAEGYARSEVTCATNLALAVVQSLAAQVACTCDSDLTLRKLADSAARDALHSLLLVNLALQVMALHESAAEQRGRQQLLPQQHHRLLLQELGIEWLVHSDLRSRSSSSVKAVGAAVIVLKHHMNLAAAQRDADDSSSSSSSAVESAALLTLLQAALLRAAGYGEDRVGAVATLLECLLLELTPSAREAAAAVLLQPVLTQLLPAAMTAVIAAAQAAAGGSNAGSQQLAVSARQAGADAAAASAGALQQELPEHWRNLIVVTGALHVLLGTGAADAQLQQAYASHPQQVCRSLKAALRCTLQDQHALEDAQDRVSKLVKAACNCVRSKPDSSSSSSSRAGLPVSDPAASKQRFSLLATCLKAAGQQADSSSSSSSSSNSDDCSSSNIDDCSSSAGDDSSTDDMDGDVAGWTAVSTTLQQHVAVLDASQRFEGQLQLLLQGRCLSLLAKSAVLVQRNAASQQNAAAEQQGDEDGEEDTDTKHVAAAYLEAVLNALSLAVSLCAASLAAAGLELPGEQAAAAKALAKLQRQGKALQQQLQAHPDMAQHQAQQQPQQQRFQGQQAEQLAQALQQFGHAICLQLPVRYWCCNPACSSVAECSELELVSRKGSRCSGCATARFCSKSCQQQCWKGQHAPVCKRIAAARRGQQKE